MDGQDNNDSIHSLTVVKLTMKITLGSCNHSTKDMITILILEDYKCVQKLWRTIYAEFRLVSGLLVCRENWRGHPFKQVKEGANGRAEDSKPETDFPHSRRPVVVVRSSGPAQGTDFHLESCKLFWVFLEVYPLYGTSTLFLDILNTTINIPKHSKALGKHIGR